jgi:hypothetical protein
MDTVIHIMPPIEQHGSKMRGMNDFAITCFEMPAVFVGGQVETHRASFNPDYWVFVARCTSGSFRLYLGDQKSDIMFRLDSGTIVLPVSSNQMSVESVVASGFYMLYAVKGLDGFKVFA